VAWNGKKKGERNRKKEKRTVYGFESACLRDFVKKLYKSRKKKENVG